MVSLVFFEDEDDVFWCWKDFLTSCRVDKWSDLGDPLVLENQTVQIIEEIREFLKKGSVFISRIIYFSSVQFISVAQSCPTLCNPVDCSTPGSPCPSPTPRVHSNSCPLVSVAIQPSQPLLFLSPPAPNPSQHQSLFHWVLSSLHLKDSK